MLHKGVRTKLNWRRTTCLGTGWGREKLLIPVSLSKLQSVILRHERCFQTLLGNAFVYAYGTNTLRALPGPTDDARNTHTDIRILWSIKQCNAKAMQYSVHFNAAEPDSSASGWVFDTRHLRLPPERLALSAVKSSLQRRQLDVVLQNLVVLLLRPSNITVHMPPSRDQNHRKIIYRQFQRSVSARARNDRRWGLTSGCLYCAVVHKMWCSEWIYAVFNQLWTVKMLIMCKRACVSAPNAALVEFGGRESEAGCAVRKNFLLKCHDLVQAIRQASLSGDISDELAMRVSEYNAMSY